MKPQARTSPVGSGSEDRNGETDPTLEPGLGSSETVPIVRVPRGVSGQDSPVAAAVRRIVEPRRARAAAGEAQVQEEKMAKGVKGTAMSKEERAKRSLEYYHARRAREKAAKEPRASSAAMTDQKPPETGVTFFVGIHEITAVAHGESLTIHTRRRPA